MSKTDTNTSYKWEADNERSKKTYQQKKALF